MFLLTELLALFLPLFALVGSSLIPVERHKFRCLVYGQVMAFIASLVGFVWFIAHREAGTEIHPVFWLFDIRADYLSVVMAVVITFIASVVVCFSERYLVGDLTRSRFVQYLIVLASVANLLVSSNNLFLCVLCWHGISIVLWRLTSLRAGNTRAGRSVLIHHLCSDALFLAAAVLVFYWCKTADLSQLSAHVAPLQTNIELFQATLPVSAGFVASVLLVLSMAIKTALFPFHRWLLATLEAPTPLSGLLHAGIVNVSAIMAARLFPVLYQAPSVLVFWGVLAAGSAILGTLISSAQSDVKRKLVYSTVGQMGFMSLQCAVGAIPAAVFHLIAHGLFKCHLFLRSGGAVSDGLLKRRWNHANPHATSAPQEITQKGGYLGWLLIFVAALPVCYWLACDPSASSKTALSVLIMTGAVATALPALKRIGPGVFMLAGLAFTGVVIIARFLSQDFDLYSAAPMLNAQWLLSGCIIAFALVSLVLHFTQGTRFGQYLYVYALNGFYVDELLSAMRNRLVMFRRSVSVGIATRFHKVMEGQRR